MLSYTRKAVYSEYLCAPRVSDACDSRVACFLVYGNDLEKFGSYLDDCARRIIKLYFTGYGSHCASNMKNMHKTDVPCPGKTNCECHSAHSSVSCRPVRTPRTEAAGDAAAEGAQASGTACPPSQAHDAAIDDQVLPRDEACLVARKPERSARHLVRLADAIQRVLRARGR